MSQKRSVLEILAAIALISGAVYFVLYTERGRRWLDRILDSAMNSLDEILASIERELAELEEGEGGA